MDEAKPKQMPEPTQDGVAIQTTKAPAVASTSIPVSEAPISVAAPEEPITAENTASSIETVSEPIQPVAATVEPVAITESSTADDHKNGAGISTEISEPSNSEQPTMLVSPSALDAKKMHNPMILIGVVVAIVVLLLAAVAYFAFLKKDSTTSSSKNISASKTKAEETVVAKDPESSNAVIESSLSKINDTTDFDAGSLSDTTLGL